MVDHRGVALHLGTEVVGVERCSGHDGTYGVKVETFDKAMKIARPVIRQIREAEADHYGSDCPIAGHHLANGVGNGTQPHVASSTTVATSLILL